ncbi:MAG TPA: hypothetical protein VLB83_03580 [Candidatus Paceibacterota bacterium]|nr:hypothetical protein [Candidatus Paceibacterota bacterium]
MCELPTAFVVLAFIVLAATAIWCRNFKNSSRSQKYRQFLADFWKNDPGL